MTKYFLNKLGSTQSFQKWVLKGSASVFDQAIYSGSNFLVGLLLARWMDIHEFGIYASVTVLFSLFYQIQNSLILEPMNVIGPAKFSTSLDHYLLQQQKFQFLLLFTVGLVISFGSTLLGLVNGFSDQIWSVMVLGLVISILQLPWFFRLSFYVKGKPWHSVTFSLIYGFTVIILISVLQNHQKLSTVTAFMSMGFAAIFSMLCLFSKIYPKDCLKVPVKFSTIISQNWRYGKWMLLTGGLFFLAGQAPIYLTGLLIGTDAAGIIKALQNLMQPMGMSVSAIVALSISSMSKDYAEGKVAQVHQKKRWVSFGTVIIALFYELLLIVGADSLEMLLYGGKFHQYAALIPLWGIIPILMAVASGTSANIRAAQKPQGIFITGVVWTVATLGFSFPMIQWWGVFGATISTVLGYAASMIAYLIIYQRWKL